MIGIDGTGPLPLTMNNNKYVLVAVNFFSKFCVARAVPNMLAITTAQFLFEDIICGFGMPKSILSDHGTNYKSNLFLQLCKLCQIQVRNSTFYHPQGNGLVERMNKTMKQIMTMYVDPSHKNWDSLLQSSVSAYNSSIQVSIGCSPYEVIFGRRPVVFADVVLSKPLRADQKPLARYVEDLKTGMQCNLDKIRCRLDQARARLVHSSVRIDPGDLVPLVNMRVEPGQSKSFRVRALGPFKVLKAFNDVNYEIVSLDSNKTQVVHYNRLRPYTMRRGQPSQKRIQTPEDQGRLTPGVESNALSVFLLSQLVAAIGQGVINDDGDGVDEYVDDGADDGDGNDADNGTVVVGGLAKCPVCGIQFKRVATQLKKKRDGAHLNYMVAMAQTAQGGRDVNGSH
jgi:hypothetical protein